MSSVLADQLLAYKSEGHDFFMLNDSVSTALTDQFPAPQLTPLAPSSEVQMSPDCGTAAGNTAVCMSNAAKLLGLQEQ